MALPFQPRWVYNDGEAVDYSMSISQHPWDPGSRVPPEVGGSDVSAAGVPAAFEIRRDYLMHLRLVFPEGEWGDVERLVRHLQRAGSATFYPDQDKVLPSHTVYGVSPAMGEEIRPRRADELSTMELEITIRRTTEAIFTDRWRSTLVKPTIAGLEIEYDAREETEAEGSKVDPWNDQSGNANNAASEGTGAILLKAGWDAATAAVRLRGSGRDDRFAYDGTVFAGGGLTLFAVTKATDISDHLPTFGTDSATTPTGKRMSLWIHADGSVIFTFGTDPHDVRTATGVITAGEKYIITARSSAASGMVIRVNGAVAKAEAGKTTLLVENNDARLGEINDQTGGGVGTKYGADKLFAWLSGYSAALTDSEIEDMEAYLSQEFGG